MIRALVLLLALAPVRAQAFATTWAPRTEAAAEAFRQGLEGQAGRGAIVLQPGPGNRALILQRARGNSASLSQTGSGNAGAIIQLGAGNSTGVDQTGGEAGVTIQVTRPGRKNRTWAPGRPGPILPCEDGEGSS